MVIDLSPAVVGGRPAFSYYSPNAPQGLYFRIASDPDGAVWADPAVLVDDGPISNVSLVEVNGRPAIAYDRELEPVNHTGEIRYVRAEDADGTSRAVPQVLFANRGVLDLNVVAGNPALGFIACDPLLGCLDLSFVRSTDPDGAVWGPPVVVAPTGLFGGSGDVNLEIVDGVPAVYFTTEVAGDLDLVRALDATGTTWGTPQTLQSDVEYFTPTHLDGRPAVAFRSSTFGTGVMQADDPAGVSWGSAVLVDRDAVGSPGVAEVGGITGLVYTVAEQALASPTCGSHLPK